MCCRFGRSELLQCTDMSCVIRLLISHPVLICSRATAILCLWPSNASFKLPGRPSPPELIQPDPIRPRPDPTRSDPALPGLTRPDLTYLIQTSPTATRPVLTPPPPSLTGVCTAEEATGGGRGELTFPELVSPPPPESFPVIPPHPPPATTLHHTCRGAMSAYLCHFLFRRRNFTIIKPGFYCAVV